MKIINVEQGSAEWLEWRKTGVTSTDMTVILKASPYKTLWRLWAEKVGYTIPVDLSGNPHVKRGKESEESGREYIETLYPEIGVLIPLCIQNEEYPFLISSTDGVDDNGENWEIKFVSNSIYQNVQENIEQSLEYQMYSVQCKHQCLVGGFQRTNLAFFNENQKPIIFKISISEEEKVKYIQECEIFYNLVKYKKEPAKDKTRDIFVPENRDDKIAWLDLAEKKKKIIEARAKMREIEKECSDLESSIEDMMGSFALGEYGGISVTKFIKRGNVNWEQLVQDLLPQLTETVIDSYRSPDKEVITFRKSSAGSSGKRARQDEFEEYALKVKNTFF